MRHTKSKKNINYKIFSTTKTPRYRCIKVLGIKVYEIFSNENFRIQKILYGLIYTQRRRTLIQERKVYKIFKFSIIERTLKNDIIVYRIFNKKVREIDLHNSFYNKYLKNLNIEYDDIYILHANSGEMYLFFAYCAKAFLNKNNSKKPLFIATQDYHVDIVKMYLPNANILYIDGLSIKTKFNTWKIQNHNCYVLFTTDYFHNIEKKVYIKEKGEIHYLDNINKTLNISSDDYTKPNIKISPEVSESLLRKIEPLNLNLNNFVIISTEAQTCEELPISLWEDVVKELQQRGHDIFLNIIDKSNYICGCKSAFLTYQEIFELAKKAKAIITLRSGLTEFLLPTETPNITVYTKFRDRKKIAFSVEKTISAFSMHKFPFLNHDLVCELNINDFNDDESLLKTIFDNFDRQVMMKEVQLV